MRVSFAREGGKADAPIHTHIRATSRAPRATTTTGDNGGASPRCSFLLCFPPLASFPSLGKEGGAADADAYTRMHRNTHTPQEINRLTHRVPYEARNGRSSIRCLTRAGFPTWGGGAAGTHTHTKTEIAQDILTTHAIRRRRAARSYVGTFLSSTRNFPACLCGGDGLLCTPAQAHNRTHTHTYKEEIARDIHTSCAIRSRIARFSFPREIFPHGGGDGLLRTHTHTIQPRTRAQKKRDRARHTHKSCAIPSGIARFSPPREIFFRGGEMGCWTNTRNHAHAQNQKE